ncbi:uncharacterized protein LOC100572705 [Acyrthosiphon pisum]|uniref:TGF-beta family profile domain-containing protein n=1 Tax=Acyrthosiphon pisum TaxID=7029 RepID=A0A8R2H4E5_ACYPI|nr:uncharacterized protein LOC100572705 [Acyrthosiphon pisum]XP_016656743.1 uncharacterized protein LOC100572705 [Acyrthosiphon pisum]|eukprot:XP_016656742.1 PREDICTED: uncharacterized protein LOC100572705 [Acyrthosiphon pisum]
MTKTSQQQITKAIMWLYKRRLDVVIDDPVVMIDVYRVDPNNMHWLIVPSIKRVVNITEPGWVPIDLQRIRMSDWFMTTDEAKDLTLVVHAYYVNKNITHIRISRTWRCTRKTTHGRGPSALFRAKITRKPICAAGTRWRWTSRTLAAIGSLRPRGTTRTTVLESVRWCPWKMVIVMVTKHSGISSCCAPRKMSNISMLHFDEDFNIIYSTLPGMVYDTCWCSLKPTI